MKDLKNWLIIISLSFVLYSLICAGLYIYVNVLKRNVDVSYDTNLVRSTYPNYADDAHDVALSIFEDYAAPKTSYRSFIGYRRQKYKGQAVTIGEDGFRESINHAYQNSVWFFGGSTMWGTGADDGRTIPSLFAKQSGEDVLNLGESGFNTIQELIQLQIMLAKGYVPKEVVFYDGVNDGYYFCQRDSNDQIRHAYTSRWITLKSDYDDAMRKLKARPILNADRFVNQARDFFKLPLRFFRKEFDSLGNKLDLSSDIPILSMSMSKKYLHCDDDEFAKSAARITINSWRSAAAILKKRGISVWFVLQPSAAFMPQKYRLDYIVNVKKQAIINESASYRSFYDTLKSEFRRSCDRFGDCSNFIDLSELFFDVDENIFIDTCHVSPNGNAMVSKALLSRIRKVTH